MSNIEQDPRWQALRARSLSITEEIREAEAAGRSLVVMALLARKRTVLRMMAMVERALTVAA